MKMKAIVALSSILFVLSTFNIGWPRFIWSWKLNVIANQYGHYAFAVCAALLFVILFRGQSQEDLRVFLSLILLVSMWSYSRATVGAGNSIAILQTQFIEAFGVLKRPSNWLSLKDLAWGGIVRRKVDFERMIYTRHESGDLTLDFYRAQNQVKPVPWVMVVHGGGWDSGDSEQLPELNWELARSGYAVVSINYRLAHDAKWPAPREDVEAARRFVEANAARFGVDAQRWVILGRSAGGQIAAAYAYGEKRSPPAGAIIFYAPTDMVFGYEVGEEDDILQSRPLMRAYMGTDPQSMLEEYHKASPTELVEDSSCPTLLLHGKSDSLVWVKHSERLATRLRARGRKVIFSAFEAGPHGFDYNLAGPEGQVAHHAVMEFLSQVVPL